MKVSDMGRWTMVCASLLIGVATAVPVAAQDSAVETARGRVLVILEGQVSVRAMEIRQRYGYSGSFSTGRGFVRITGRARLISLMSDVAESVEITATVFSREGGRGSAFTGVGFGRPVTGASRPEITGTMTFARVERTDGVGLQRMLGAKFRRPSQRRR